MSTTPVSTFQAPGVFIQTPYGGPQDPNAFGIRPEDAKENGFVFVDLLAPPSGQRTPAAATVVRDTLRANSLTPVYLFAGHEGETYGSLAQACLGNGYLVGGPKQRKARLAEFRECANFAREAEIPYIGVHIGEISASNLDRAAECLRQMLAIAESNGLILGLETGPVPAPLNALLFQWMNDARMVFQFDPGNVILYRMGNPTDYLKTMLDVVPAERVTVHAKDARFSFDPEHIWLGGADVEIGTGQVDFLAIARLLAQKGQFRSWRIER